MKHLYCFTLLAISLSLPFRSAAAETATETPAPNRPAKEKFQLYLLIGQSNMSGRGDKDANTVASVLGEKL